MATFLYKVGKLSFRRRRLIALFWVLLLGLTGFAAAQSNSSPSDSFAIPGTEAQTAYDLIEERFPGSSADGAIARVVLRVPSGEKVTSGDNKKVVADLVADLKSSSDQVASVTDPFKNNGVSKDGTTAYTQVSYKVQSGDMTEETRSALEETVQERRDDGMTVEIGGDALKTTPEAGSAEIIGIGVSAIVLIITFASLVSAGLPLFTAIVGVGIGISAIHALTSVLELSSTTSSLASMIGLAVGIDYALFIVSRHRSELQEGHTPEESAGRAVGTAGSAVVFAGLTVVIALVGLTVVNIPVLTKMGLAAAATVVIAVLIALTLIPALLGFAGHRVLSRKARKALAEGNTVTVDAAGKPNAGKRWAMLVLRWKSAALVLGIAVLAVFAIPVGSMELSLGDDGTKPISTTQRRAYDMLDSSFGPGANGPLMVVVDATEEGDPKDYVKVVRSEIEKIEGVAKVSPARFNDEGTTSVFNVSPEFKPSSSETESLVEAIRTTTDDTVQVTGQTAMNIDVSQKLNDALVPYLALVVSLAFILLMLVFRSILVPLKAALGFLLSVVAALGAVVAVFQWGWFSGLFGVEQPAPIMSIVPIFLIGVVFGLAMDYEVFLVTRMREAYVHGEAPRRAVIVGFEHGVRVVTAAAVIMVSVFAGFMGSTDTMIKMMGFGLAIAVVFDAFIVRMTIVPAVLGLLGKAAWWLPRWLDRILPDVDVEGSGLEKSLAGPTASPGAVPSAGSSPEDDRSTVTSGQS
ncbi:MMPL family transporter [Streptomyces sp. NPDC057675]|uniref:MMPL family transporter n=1 Tax=Streptomyces sp. NPDC057675 TaxID=3346204 RepID=UPI0036A52513